MLPFRAHGDVRLFFFLPSMNLQQLRFVRETIRRDFNLTQAARALGISQPALSRGILELERELGVAIFLRHGKRILGLSEPGKAVAERAARVLAEVHALEAAGAEFRRREAGELRIATTHTQARYVLPRVVAEFKRRYPDVHLTLLQGAPRQITQWVVEREVDFALATEVPEGLAELRLIAAFEWQHVLVVPHGHPLLAAPLTLEAVAAWPLVTYVEEFAGRRRIDRAFDAAGLVPDVVLTAIDSDVIKTYVALGLGVGIMAEMAYEPLRDRALAVRPAGALFGRNRVRLALRRDTYLRGFARRFIEMLIPGVRLDDPS